ncbi:MULTISPECIES: hypothetical protein [unclassified Paenibacillus]|uniref:hypothetical protein n=1 Tax=unclassified Paenibacillus TaxID=185978 RepID=UPI00041D563E|nr:MULTISPECIES: hypothetical protein [unclassified Paenibacillus]
MKAVPKVNTDGLYLEDELVDDAFSGVVPFYAPIELPELKGELPETPEEEQEPKIVGYLIGLPVPSGLFHPRFDIAGWEAYQKALEDGPQEMFPDLWREGLSQEEIDELTKPQSEEPSELDKLKQENILLKAQNAALTERADFIEDVIAEIAAQVYQ